MTKVIDAAHQQGARVALTVQSFAWTTAQASTQAALLGSATTRQNLARQVAAAVTGRGADGVNLDFEPIVSGYSDEFTAFVRLLRSTLGPGYEITFDTTGYIGNYPIADATASGGADAVFVMGYDYRLASSSYAGSIAPLGGPAYDVTDTVDAYLDRIGPGKIILGVPYYGRAWSTSTTTLDAKVSGSCASAAVFYADAMPYLEQNGRRYDPIEQVAWTVYQRSGCSGYRELYLDDAQALKAKYDLINARGLRGVGIWALGYDGTRPELYQALADKFVNDTTPPVVGISALPETNVDEGFLVRWTGRDDSGIASYDVQLSVDGAAWVGWLTGTTATGRVYLGADGHGSASRGRAQDPNGNISAWDVTSTAAAAASLTVGGFARVTVDGLSVRAAASTSATWLGTLHAGDMLHLIGGPVAADGYTWYQFDGPLTEWSPVASTQTGVWAAAGGGGVSYLVPRAPLNVTTVHAGLRGLGFGGPAPSGVGPAAIAARRRLRGTTKANAV